MYYTKLLFAITRIDFTNFIPVALLAYLFSYLPNTLVVPNMQSNSSKKYYSKERNLLYAIVFGSCYLLMTYLYVSARFPVCLIWFASILVVKVTLCTVLCIVLWLRANLLVFMMHPAVARGATFILFDNNHEGNFKIFPAHIPSPALHHPVYPLFPDHSHIQCFSSEKKVPAEKSTVSIKFSPLPSLLVSISPIDHYITLHLGSGKIFRLNSKNSQLLHESRRSHTITCFKSLCLSLLGLSTQENPNIHNHFIKVGIVDSLRNSEMI